MVKRADGPNSVEKLAASHAPALNGTQFTENEPALGSATLTIEALQRQTEQDAAIHKLVPTVVPHAAVMKALLEQVSKLDFRKVVGLNNDAEKLRQKHYVVTVVEEVL